MQDRHSGFSLSLNPVRSKPEFIRRALAIGLSVLLPLQTADIAWAQNAPPDQGAQSPPAQPQPPDLSIGSPLGWFGYNLIHSRDLLAPGQGLPLPPRPVAGAPPLKPPVWNLLYEGQAKVNGALNQIYRSIPSSEAGAADKLEAVQQAYRQYQEGLQILQQNLQNPKYSGELSAQELSEIQELVKPENLKTFDEFSQGAGLKPSANPAGDETMKFEPEAERPAVPLEAEGAELGALETLGVAAKWIGSVLIVIGAAISLYKIWTAPEGQHARVATQELGAWALGFGFGIAGAKLGAALGFAIGGPLGAFVGAAFIGLCASIVGAFLGSALGKKLYDWLFGGGQSGSAGNSPPWRAVGASVHCDCEHVDFGLLTGPYIAQCQSAEQVLLQSVKAETFKVTVGPDGNLTGSGPFCDPVAHGPAAWPLSGGPATPPPRDNAPPCKYIGGLVQYDCSGK
jgi:hypothetical protein